jgi:hypothetical protein
MQPICQYVASLLPVVLCQGSGAHVFLDAGVDDSRSHNKKHLSVIPAQ